MLEKNVLSDQFKQFGSDYEEFIAAVAGMDARTKFKKTRGRDCIFMSKEDNHPSATEDSAVYTYLDREGIRRINDCEKRLMAQVKNARFGEDGEEILKEMENTTKLILVVDNEMYPVSSIAINSLTARAGVSGPTTAGRANFIRNAHLADGVLTRDDTILLAYREVQTGTKEDGTPIIVKKLFAAHGGRYQPVPQKTLVEVLDEINKEHVMGKMMISNWCISQEFTEIAVGFPEVGLEMQDTYKLPNMMTPGLHLYTSDTGESSVIVRSTFSSKYGTIYADKVQFMHTSGVTVEKILKEADEKLFSQFRKLPETLVTLLGIDVCDYSSLPAGPDGEEIVKNKLRNIYDAVLKKVFQPEVRTRLCNTLLEQLVGEINPTVKYTLYDVAMTFMGIPDRIDGISTGTAEAIREAGYRVPFFLEKKGAEIASEEGNDYDLVLLPE